MDTQDIIIFEPAAVLIIRDATIYEVISDPKYEPIIISLRKGPMTLRELKKHYSELAEEDEKYKKKEETTIFKYLQILEKYGLVKPAGKRISMAKTSTETLYSRTAKTFYPKLVEMKFDVASERFPRIEKVLEIFPLLIDTYGDKITNLNGLRDYVYSTYRKIDEILTNFFENFSNELSEILLDCKYADISEIIGILTDLLIGLNGVEFEKGLKDYIEKK